MHPSARALPWFALLALLLPGCSDSRPDYWEGGLMLTGIQKADLPPVNLTDAAIDQYPPLRQLFDEWERDHPPGTSPLDIGAGIDYPYEDGVGLIQAIQAKEVGVNWPKENSVLIAHEGKLFQLDAGKPHRN